MGPSTPPRMGRRGRRTIPSRLLPGTQSGFPTPAGQGMSVEVGSVTWWLVGLPAGLGLLVALLIGAWLTGRLTIDLGWGRTRHPLGPAEVEIDAPRDLVVRGGGVALPGPGAPRAPGPARGPRAGDRPGGRGAPHPPGAAHLDHRGGRAVRAPRADLLPAPPGGVALGDRGVHVPGGRLRN